MGHGRKRVGDRNHELVIRGAETPTDSAAESVALKPFHLRMS